MHSYVLIAAIAYLLGSIPFGFLLVLLFRKEDIRSKGSGNIGATNVLRSGGKWLGLATFLLDAAKGYLAVFIGGLIWRYVTGAATNIQSAGALAAIVAVLGHMAPVWLRFKGGKGVATALGVFLALSPAAALIGLAIFALVFYLSRYVSLASLASAVTFPIAALAITRGQRTPLFLTAVLLVPLLVILRHHQNIGRLLHGTEHRFSKPKATAA